MNEFRYAIIRLNNLFLTLTFRIITLFLLFIIGKSTTKLPGLEQIILWFGLYIICWSLYQIWEPLKILLTYHIGEEE